MEIYKLLEWEQDGKYSVKAGYFLEINNDAPPPFHQDWWKSLWKLKIPPKVRIFLWRASWNFIPSLMNLLIYHVPVNGICALCKIYHATTNHVLLFCPGLRNVWRNTFFWKELKKVREAPCIEIALVLSKLIKVEDFQMFLMICRAVWAETCKRIYETLGHNINISIDRASSFLDCFRLSDKSCTPSTV